MKINIDFEINDDEEKARLVVLLQVIKCVLIGVTAFVHSCLNQEAFHAWCCRRMVETTPQGQALHPAANAAPFPQTQQLPAAAPQEAQSPLNQNILSQLLPPDFSAQSVLPVCPSTGA